MTDAREGERAGFVSRGLAFVADITLVTLLISCATWVVRSAESVLGQAGSAWAQGYWLFVVYPLTFAVYNVAFWVLAGRTPGKWLLGLEVVDLEGNRLRVGRAIVRAVMYWPSAFVFDLGFLWVLGRQRRAWHDHLSGAQVVYRRREASRRPPAKGVAPSPRQPRLGGAPGVVSMMAGLMMGGCAQGIGERATQGAMDTLVEQETVRRVTEKVVDTSLVTATTPEQLAHIETLVARVASAAMESATSPEQMARLEAALSGITVRAVEQALYAALREGKSGDSLIEQATRQTLTTVGTTVAAELGNDFSNRIAAVVERSSMAATSGSLGTLVPRCRGSRDPDCLRVELASVAEASGRSFTRGVLAALRPWFMLAVFAMGILVALLGMLLVRGLRQDRPLMRPAHAG
jgi:uncharacterized RDD family membrane protein YckC